MGLIEQLKAKREAAQAEIERIDGLLAAITDLVGTETNGHAPTAVKKKPNRYELLRLAMPLKMPLPTQSVVGMYLQHDKSMKAMKNGQKSAALINVMRDHPEDFRQVKVGMWERIR